MKLSDFLANVSALDYLEDFVCFGPSVRFRIYSGQFYIFFRDLGFNFRMVRCGAIGNRGYYEISMRYTEFRKMLKTIDSNEDAN